MIGPPGAVFQSPATLADRLDAVTPVDVRDEHAYAAGHIPGAVNVPFDEIRDPGSVAPGLLPDQASVAETLGAAGIDPDDSLVAYDGARGVNAARFLLTAAIRGHEGDLSLLDGDMAVWQRSFSTEASPATHEPVEYEPSPAVDPPTASRGAVQAAIDGETLLVDTRSPTEYEQAHVPGAVQLSWETLVGADRRLKPRSELEATLDDCGLSRDREILLYCNTARRLSHTFAVLTELGFDRVRFYEGRLTELIRATADSWDPASLAGAVREAAGGGFDGIAGEIGDDGFSRLHLVGLYTQKQDDHFMVRTKIPGGRITAEQARALGAVAETYARAPADHGGTTQNPVFGDGFLDITTRQGVQFHWVSPADVPDLWDRIEATGITTLQASGNTLRNVVSCPLAGLDDVGVDPRPIADDLADAFEGESRYANLPRKLKVSVVGCPDNCGRAEIQDLGFTPARKDGRQGFHVKVGGGLSDGPRAATDLGIFLTPEQVTPLATATADLFVEHGSYLETAVNRLRYLVAEWGTARFRDRLEARAQFAFESAGTDLTDCYRGDHVGVHDHGDGEHAVGLAVPTGRMGGAAFKRLGTLAEEYGAGELRLTPNQNVVMPHVPAGKLDALLDEPLLEQYTPEPGPFTRGIVTCTGREFCDYGLIETKTRGIRMARELDAWAAREWADPPDVVRVHMSGCSAACAQPQIADIGLRGETVRDRQGTRPAVDVGVGGDLAVPRFIEWAAHAVPAERLPDVVRRLTRAADGEIGQWLESTPSARVQELVMGQGAATPAGGD
jgi:ferredoxin-nitrite reductase